MSGELIKIARKSGARKKYLKQFCEKYEIEFTPMRDRSLNILELGVGGYKDESRGGGSLKMWASFFPNATIVGVDINQKTLDLPNNVFFERGSQTDSQFLLGLVAKYGVFDIIIDDASHVTEKTIKTFEILFPHTRHFYVVEDLHMAKAVGTIEYFSKLDNADLSGENICFVQH